MKRTINDDHKNKKKKKKNQTLIHEKIAAVKPKIFVFKKIAFFKKMMMFKIMSTSKKTYDDEKKKPLSKKTIVKKQLMISKSFSKKKSAFKDKTAMNKLIKIIVFVLISFLVFTSVFECEFSIPKLSIFNSFLKKPVVKKRQIPTPKKNDFVSMMHETNQKSVINENFLIGFFDFEIRKTLFKNKRAFSFVMTC